MVFASGLGIALSLVFGCLLLALVAELYYLLWWKKLRINSNDCHRVEDDYSTGHSKELMKPPQPSSLSHQGAAVATTTATDTSDVEMGSSKDLVIRDIGDDQEALVEAELMRLQNRLLFTIKEETKEDLESEDGKSKASRKGSSTRSLSDLILNPVPYPLLKIATKESPESNPEPLDCSSMVEEELSRLRSSPPPKLKFLRDAEEKLYRRMLEEAQRIKNGGFQSSVVQEEEDWRNGSFIRIIVGKNIHNHNHQRSSSSQLLPLPSSPSLSASVEKKPILD